MSSPHPSPVVEVLVFAPPLFSVSLPPHQCSPLFSNYFSTLHFFPVVEVLVHHCFFTRNVLCSSYRPQSCKPLRAYFHFLFIHLQSSCPLLRPPPRMFLISSLAHVINTHASTCSISIYMCIVFDQECRCHTRPTISTNYFSTLKSFLPRC